jgi:hypothetical protein
MNGRSQSDFWTYSAIPDRDICVETLPSSKKKLIGLDRWRGGKGM